MQHSACNLIHNIYTAVILVLQNSKYKDVNCSIHRISKEPMLSSRAALLFITVIKIKASAKVENISTGEIYNYCP
jgi:hypothetical protein